jgi:hypothetical protein
LSPVRGGLPLGDTPPRRCVPVASLKSPPRVFPELNVSAAASPSKSRLTARSQLASLSPPTRSHDSCYRPKTGRLLQEAKFPSLLPPPGPPPPSPSLPVLCKTGRHRRSHSRYQTSPRFRPAAALRAQACSRNRGLLQGCAASLSLPVTRSWAPGEKALTLEPNFMLATGMGWRTGVRGGGRAHLVQAF